MTFAQCSTGLFSDELYRAAASRSCLCLRFGTGLGWCSSMSRSWASRVYTRNCPWLWRCWPFCRSWFHSDGDCSWSISFGTLQAARFLEPSWCLGKERHCCRHEMRFTPLFPYEHACSSECGANCCLTAWICQLLGGLLEFLTLCDFE